MIRVPIVIGSIHEYHQSQVFASSSSLIWHGRELSFASAQVKCSFRLSRPLADFLK